MPTRIRPGAAGRTDRSATGRSLRVQTRIGLILAATAAIFAVVMLVIQNTQRRQLDLMLDERAAETNRVLEQVLELRANGAKAHADDYSRWDDFVKFVHSPDPRWAQVNLTDNIATFDLDGAWVLDPGFHVVFTANPDETPGMNALPVAQDVLQRALARRPVRHFFVTMSAGLLELWTSSIVPSDDFRRETPPQGYYMIGRLWTPARLAELSSVAGGKVQVLPARLVRPGSLGSVETGAIDVQLALPGINNRPAAGLEFSTRFAVVQQVHQALLTSLLVAICGSMCMLILVWLALVHWVGQPLEAITRAMQREDTSSLEAIHRRHDELGHVARLVEDFFEQRARLVEAREAAEALANSRAEFLANVSHELRTPMHGILSFARFGLRDARDAAREDLRENFQQIHECGSGLLEMLNNLLDLTKIEAGYMPFTFAEVSLPELAEEALDEFLSFYRAHRIELRFESEPGLPGVVGDRMRILQVLRNLISNAAKFTPAEGVVLVRVAAAGPAQRLIVEDTGIGVPAGEEERIFQKFMQASHTSPGGGGTGLGLAICREIAAAHEGRVWAENREGGGARITFEVPVAGPVSRREPGEDVATTTPAGRPEPIADAAPGDQESAPWRKSA